MSTGAHGEDPVPGDGAASAADPAAVLGPDAALDDQAVHRARLQHGQRVAGLTLEQLWLRFFAVGGDAGLVELDAYLSGVMPLPARQRDLLAQAVNERLDELFTSARVPFSSGRPAGAPQAGVELPALVGLLAASPLAPPEQLPVLAAAAYRTLGVDVTLYLADHDQRLLVPAPAAPGASPLRTGAGQARPLSIDATVAGRAFRDVRTLAGEAAGHQLWLPLLDGTRPLGVLEVQVPDAGALVDGVLREQCERLASLLGHLLGSVSGRGDALEAVRRTRPRTPSAELVWQLLPPTSAATDRLEVSGWLEPADTVGGDVFDYALSPACVSLAVFDGRGEGLLGGLLAAAAVSAYRSARRDGRDLRAQAEAVDAAVSGLDLPGSAVSGFLGALDLATGRLSYLSAGHPEPLLLDGEGAVRSLAGGRRPPFGLGRRDAAAGSCQDVVGGEDLAPGDWLAVHSDGVTGARDAAGEPFGVARLADVLQAGVAAGQLPAETARRLAHAVLAHQDGPLQDDATVLLARWLPP